MYSVAYASRVCTVAYASRVYSVAYASRVYSVQQSDVVRDTHRQNTRGTRMLRYTRFTASNSERFVRMPKQFEWGARMLFAMLILFLTACQNSEHSKSNVLNPNTSFSEPDTRAGAE